MNTPYDVIRYPCLCHPQTHPDRLAVVGNLVALNTADPAACRYLELGCGDGGNLLPLATMFPGSQFVGIDLAPTSIELGQRHIQELGLKNVKLIQGDITQFPAEGETYDYVVAHGVYSWVPAPVREALLNLCRHRLTPQGVAFVSYNCLPGCHIRRMVRDIMRFHIRTVEDPRQKIGQAVAVTRFIANSIEEPDNYRRIFKEQLEQIERYGPGHLFHDDLSDINEPVHFHEFMSHAARYGLQFVGEADFYEMQDNAFSEETQALMAQLSGDRLTREQYLDFLKCRRFRQTLLCHCETPLTPVARPEAMMRFHIASAAKAEAAGTSAAGGRVEERFIEPKGGAIVLDHPAGRAALKILRERWPSTVGFDDLVSLAASAVPGLPTEKVRADLAAIFLDAYRVGVVECRRTPLRCVASPTERPRVWEFARWQIQHEDFVTTLRGENVRVQDTEGKALLRWVDGTRTVDELVACMAELNGEEDPKLRLLERLRELGEIALLDA